jgi:acyl carrier protein
MSIIEKKLTIEERVNLVLAEQLCLDDEAITPQSKIEEDFGADSLDVTECVMALEAEFDIVISDKDVAKLETVQDVVNLVHDRMVA